MSWHKIDFIFNGRFSINEQGEVINNLTRHIISPYITNKGYYAIDLNCDGKRQKWLLHRLVALMFVPNPNNYPIVMHLDNNRLNHSINNLKWGTYSDNNKQAVREKRMIVPTPDNRKEYIILNENTKDYVICNGIKEAINILGFGNDSQIRNYIFRNTKIPYGKYKNYKISKLLRIG
nr:MAG TPA: homing endonuclease [Caudoviricetes sp.]